MKKLYLGLTFYAALLLQGCASHHAVIATTGTVLGFDLSENPATQLYHVKFGYVRSELAYVPSNRAINDSQQSYKNGATDVADVIMELRFENLLKGGGLYQRLAVGSVAVKQPGASLMFAKDSTGTINAVSAAAVASSVQTVPARDPAVAAATLPLASAYHNAANKAAFDTVAQLSGYPTFIQLILDTKLTKDGLDKICTDLKAAGLIK